MKKYRILKNYKDFNGDNMLEGNTLITEGNEQLYNFLVQNGFIEEGIVEEGIVEEKSIYNLKKGDEYYVINSIGDIESTIWANDNYDISRLEYGNVFLTKEDVEKELAKRKARASIDKWSYFNDKNYKFQVGEVNYYIYYNFSREKFLIGQYEYNKEVNCFFSSEKIAKKAREELKSEYKILFDI